MLNRFGLGLVCWRCVIVSTIAVAHFNFALAKIREDAQRKCRFYLGGGGGCAKNCGDE